MHVSNAIRERCYVQTHHSLALLHIDLVAYHDLRCVSCCPFQSQEVDPYKWKGLRIHRARLYQELIPPAIQCLKTLGIVHIVYQNAAIRASVKRHAQTLEAFLSCRIPNLFPFSFCSIFRRGGSVVARTCIVTNRSSTRTSLVRKSAPIVALYEALNFLLTYWFIKLVFPTPESPSIYS